ncbi:MAG: hypothetical protein MSS84_06095 [Bacteroidales bacterium]|nr:hypothetical protein [Bacteroidales bacterium]
MKSKRKTKQLRLFAALLLLVAAMVMPSVAWAQITPEQPQEGIGTKDNPYKISSAEQLYWFAALVNGDASVCTGNVTQNTSVNAVLTDNIVVNEDVLDANGSLNSGSFTAWTPIGNSSTQYSGTFDGRGHTISGLYFNDSNIDCVGLFGNNSGTIQNVGVVDSYFNGKNYVGGVCGQNQKKNKGGVTLANCYNTGTVSGTSYVGGVCGYNFALFEGSVTLANCYNTGTVNGSNQVGGVCGLHNANYQGAVTITNCYNTGTVSGTSYVGGVCGNNSANQMDGKSTITNCYNTSTVSGTSYVGGVCGQNYSESGGKSTITNCYYYSENYTGNAVGKNNATINTVTAKTAEQFASGEVAWLLNSSITNGTQAWYQNLSSESGDAYPVLKSTEGNTVYGGYQHGETTIHYSNSASDYPHAHAYDSSASDEENGNHDKSYQGVFNWTDNDDKTDVTVTATFTCSVCRKVETPDVTAVHDNEHTNTPAACTEVGYNYFKTSYAFTGATFTDSYTQTVPVLGHNMNEITFNEGEKIYSNQCQREGCGYADYYATSDGSVEAKLEDGIYKVESFDLADATPYNSEAEFTVTSLAYKRTFYDDKWMAVYVPFAIDCSQLPDFMEMAVINNFHEYEQEDGSYNVVLEVKRKTSGTIPALTPCVMRLKTAPIEGFETLTMRFSNAVFSPAADNYIDCSSVTRYYKFTGSLTGKSGFDEASDFVPLNGDVVRASGDTNLEPQRWFLTATNRGSTTPLPVGLQRIAIRVMGDNEGEGGGTITSIDTLHLIEGLYTESGRIVCAGEFRIYDLLGRDVTRLNGSLCGVYVVKVGEAAVKVVVK